MTYICQYYEKKQLLEVPFILSEPPKVQYLLAIFAHPLEYAVLSIFEGMDKNSLIPDISSIAPFHPTFRTAFATRSRSYLSAWGDHLLNL